MIASRNQNQLQSSLTLLGDLLKVLIFLSNLNGFNSSLSPSVQGYNQRKGSSRVWKEKGLQVILSLFFFFFLFLCVHYLCVLLSSFESVQFLCFTLFNMFLFGYFSVLLSFVFHIKIKKKKLKNQKNTKTVCVLCTLVFMYLGWPLKQSFLNFVSFVAQMSISMYD